MNKLVFSKSSFLNIYYFLLIYGLIYSFSESILIGFTKDSWNITEFLINYEGGFVRRGLLGEVIFDLYQYFGINPYHTILFISISAFVLFNWFFIKTFIKQGYPLFILPFNFFLGNPVVNGFWLRKDILIVLIFILTIYFALKKSRWNLIISNLILISGLLIHEGIGFFCFPVLLLLLYDKNRRVSQNTVSKSILISFFQIIPAIITFLIVLYFKGSKEIASQIWNSWKSIPFPFQDASNFVQPPNALDGISWSFKQGISFTQTKILEQFDHGIYAPVAWLITLLLIYYILTNLSKLNVNILKLKTSTNFDKTRISAILIFQFISIAPLFIIGADYGRWIFYWVTSSFALILLIPGDMVYSMIPRIISDIGIKINLALDVLLGKVSIILLCLLVAFPHFSWTLGACIKSHSFYTILHAFGLIGVYNGSLLLLGKSIPK